MSRIKPTWVQIKAKLVGFLGTFKKLCFSVSFFVTSNGVALNKVASYDPETIGINQDSLILNFI